jgi:hypothetical protein
MGHPPIASLRLSKSEPYFFFGAPPPVRLWWRVLKGRRRNLHHVISRDRLPCPDLELAGGACGRAFRCRAAFHWRSGSRSSASLQSSDGGINLLSQAGNELGRGLPAR